MTFSAATFLSLWHDLIWPLLRLLGYVSLSLFAANLIESLNWTSKIAALARPLMRLGNLSDISSASFTMALFSGISANTMLSEAYEQNKISRKELVLANLFNSMPVYFLHLPSVSMGPSTCITSFRSGLGRRKRLIRRMEKVRRTAALKVMPT